MYKKRALENMKGQWGASLLVLCIYAALLTLGNAIPVVGSIIIAGPLYFGLTYIYYHASFEEKGNINYWDIFKGFEVNFGETFLAQVLVGVYSFLWGLLFIIPGIIKSISYSMFMYLMVREPGLHASAAIRKSQEYMKGYKWKYFCLLLSFIGWDILCALTAGILLVYVAPYKQHAITVFYNDVYEARTNGASAYTPKANPTVKDIDPQYVEKEPGIFSIREVVEEPFKDIMKDPEINVSEDKIDLGMDEPVMEVVDDIMKDDSEI